MTVHWRKPVSIRTPSHSDADGLEGATLRCIAVESESDRRCAQSQLSVRSTRQACLAVMDENSCPLLTKMQTHAALKDFMEDTHRESGLRRDRDTGAVRQATTGATSSRILRGELTLTIDNRTWKCPSPSLV